MRSTRLALLLLANTPLVVIAQTSPAGCWAGTLASGAAQRRAVLEFAQAGGNWTPRLIVLGRNTDPESVTDFEVRGDSIFFRVPSMPGAPTFSGRIEADKLSGVMRGSTPQPVSLTLVRDSTITTRLTGRWFGWLTQNGAGVLRIGINVLPAPCGQLLITMDSPDQGTNDLPMTDHSVRGDSLFLEMSYLKGDFQGGLVGDSLIGRWTQSGASLVLRLGRRDSSLIVTRRPQEPVAPFPYAEERVTYQNPADGTRLAGTLTIPPGPGPFPAVLLLTGSGAQDRNEAIMGHKPFLVIADYLTRRNIAVLRVDDRGVGGSSGDTFKSTISDNAGDALAGVEFLRHHAKVDSTRVGLLGHSEGGWVAPLAASRSRAVAFVVLLAGPAVTGEEIRYSQDSVLALAAGSTIVMVSANHKISSAIHRVLKAEPNDSIALTAMLRAADSMHRRLTPAEKAAMDSSGLMADTAAMRQRLQILTTPWYRYLLTYDPVPALRALRVPALALYGEKDLQVPPLQSVPVLERAVAGKRNVTIRVFPGLNHLFQHAATGLIDEYARIDETVAPEVLQAIGDWILRR